MSELTRRNNRYKNGKYWNGTEVIRFCDPFCVCDLSIISGPQFLYLTPRSYRSNLRSRPELLYRRSHLVTTGHRNLDAEYSDIQGLVLDNLVRDETVFFQQLVNLLSLLLSEELFYRSLLDLTTSEINHH